MPRAKRFSDVKRMFFRRLAKESDATLVEVRDRIWDDHIARRFFAGTSVERLSEWQPTRNSSSEIQDAIRRVVKRRR